MHTDPNEMEYATRHNRLLYYEVYDGDDPNADNLLRTVTYTYYETGNVSNISIKDEYLAGMSGTAADYDYVRDLAPSRLRASQSRPPVFLRRSRSACRT